MFTLAFVVAVLAVSPTCPFDLDGDGDVGVTDFLSLLAQWGTDPAGPPDFDGDGTVGITDFLLLLAEWGPCSTGACCLGDGACSVTTQAGCAGSWAAGASCVDSDFDRLPDAFERDDCGAASGCFAGTHPSHPDTDGDGISDGDEVLGTAGGLDLPALGANALRKDIFVETDWMSEDADSGPHTHRPSFAAVHSLVNTFANASEVQNPCGVTGIALHVDHGQAGAYTGGSLIGDDTVVLFPVEFNVYKAAHFDANRQGYFHYSIHCHRFNDPDNGSSGIAELPGDDFIVSLGSGVTNSNVSKTTLHELGHNLSLRHGGFENLNFKPNYNSVMNYRYQFPGADITCDALGDGVLDYSHGLNLVLDETGLRESEGVCGGTPIDWNGNSVVDLEPVAWNINCRAGTTTHCGDHAGGNCYDATCDVLVDFSDWIYLVIPIPRGAAAAAREIVTCQDTPPSP
ncbi:MAG: hypothetical protein ACYTGF_04845 [Planctomycetota bacterium]